MDEVVEHVNSLDCFGDGLRVAEITRRDLHLAGPGDVGELQRIPHKDAHPISRLEEPRHEPPSDIPGRPGDKYLLARRP